MFSDLIFFLILTARLSTYQTMVQLYRQRNKFNLYGGTMKKLYVVMIAVLFIALTTVVFAATTNPASSATAPAKHQGCAGFQGSGSFHHGFWSHLNLSKEQMGKMHEIKTRYYKETRNMRYELEQKRIEVRKLFTDPKTDDTTLLAKEKELNTLKLKLMDKMAEMKIEQRKTLTPEQLQKLDTMSMDHHHGHRHGE